jgi:hypothetical protein
LGVVSEESASRFALCALRRGRVPHPKPRSLRFRVGYEKVGSRIPPVPRVWGPAKLEGPRPQPSALLVTPKPCVGGPVPPKPWRRRIGRGPSGLGWEAKKSAVGFPPGKLEGPRDPLAQTGRNAAPGAPLVTPQRTCPAEALAKAEALASADPKRAAAQVDSPRPVCSAVQPTPRGIGHLCKSSAMLRAIASACSGPATGVVAAELVAALGPADIAVECVAPPRDGYASTAAQILAE